MHSAREIFEECCMAVASSFANNGFRYRASQHTAIKATGDLKFEIHFQSSLRNYLMPNEGSNSLKRVASKLLPLGDLATFGKVSLIVHASVHSKKLRAFRKSRPSSWT